ncbi:hypothetical protein [Actinoplanes flavus]|uniref:Iron uptake protein n=1 Tax=Actinoplanes flavus TaxID=2820290 RepID=A0ABS3UE82_9ACTN|nr:hypothetical protein [Actinoplanes flavus]MBO3736751.1 hypothetical protein [Actinoplanes flavus]
MGENVAMIGDERGLRVAASVFGRTLWVIAGAVPFFYMVAGAEVAWMERLSDNGTGSVIGTALIWAVLLALFLGAMLFRFRGARIAAVSGWALSLLPAVGVFALLYGYMYVG